MDGRPLVGRGTPRPSAPLWQGRGALLGSLALAWILLWGRQGLLLGSAEALDVPWLPVLLDAVFALASLGAALLLFTRPIAGARAALAIGLGHLLLGFFLLDLFRIPGQPAETIVLSVVHRLVGLHLLLTGWQRSRLPGAT